VSEYPNTLLVVAVPCTILLQHHELAALNTVVPCSIPLSTITMYLLLLLSYCATAAQCHSCPYHCAVPTCCCPNMLLSQHATVPSLCCPMSLQHHVPCCHIAVPLYRCCPIVHYMPLTIAVLLLYHMLLTIAMPLLYTLLYHCTIAVPLC